ncbi:hypothetical protein ABBQ32_007514 [Trebouxia sp. C0010 RCD-2024]
MHRLLLRLSQRSVSGITHISGRLEINSVAIPSASELVNLCRGVSTATAAGALPIQGDTPIQQAIQACCSSLGRQPGTAEATLADRLTDNWYVTAADVAALTQAEATALKVPVRFLHELRALLPQAAQNDDAHSGNGAQLDAGLDSVKTAEVTLEEESCLVTSELQTALMAAPQMIAANSDLPNDIMQRRCPPLKRFRHGAASKVKVTTRKRQKPYALKKIDMPKNLQDQFEDFHKFNTSRFFGQQADPIAICTSDKYADHARGILGWLHHVKGLPLSELSMKAAVPSKTREGVKVAFDYMHWLAGERRISCTTEGVVIRSLMQMAKFLYHKGSSSQPLEGDKAYGDLLVIRELRKLSTSNRRAARVAVRASDEGMKWLEWPEYLQTVQELRRECAGRNDLGALRPRSAVAWSLQRYLIFAILSSIPDRQRTLRELQVGQTLFKDEQGRWVIRHGPGHYKTGKAYGERPPMVIAPHIYPELEAFLDEWRVELYPLHDFVFSRADGQPLTAAALYKLFTTSCYRITGKKTNPHLVRDSIVTYLRSTGASERELEALAIYMGHSLEMQRGTYDRRTKAAKVEPAISLLGKINRDARRI